MLLNVAGKERGIKALKKSTDFVTSPIYWQLMFYNTILVY